MRRNKKTIRLTETEMVSMIERIVNEVKREKRRQVNESRYNEKRLLQEKHQRLILESEGEIILADLETMDENNPNPVLKKLQTYLKRLERTGKRELNDFKKKLSKFQKKINRAAARADRNIKKFFMKIFNESYSYNEKRLLQEKHQRLILESEGEIILADLETMDENNPNPVIEKLKRHIEILKRKGGRELSDFMDKLDGFKDKLELAKRKVGSKFRDFFEDIFGRNRLKKNKNALKTGLRNNRRRPNNRSGKSQIVKTK